ncbi:MAG: amidohydrolase family protein, partial [Stellaceae bacterium]
DVIAFLTERLLAAGHSAPKFHATAHAALAEREATHRAISLAELIDVPVLIVHVSGREAIDQIAWARNRGLKIYAETCPQYLFLSEDDLDQPGIEGARCMCSPPPRDRANQEFVWRGLEAGIFDVFSSDHAPYRMDAGGKLHAGPNPSFKKIGNGVPGIEVRLPLLFSEGVRTGRIDLNRFVALSATTAAKLYGLYPRKGTIAVGSDADIAIWDPELEVTVRQEILHDAMDYTPYAGRQVTGWPVMTISRGDVVWGDGAVKGAAGRGRFLPCELPAAAKPRGKLPINFDPTTRRLVTPT